MGVLTLPTIKNTMKAAKNNPLLARLRYHVTGTHEHRSPHMETTTYKNVSAYAARLAKAAMQASAKRNPDGTISASAPSVGTILARAKIIESRDNGRVCVMADDWREIMRAFALPNTTIRDGGNAANESK